MAPILSLRAGELATDLAGLVVPYDLSSSAVVRDGSTFEDLFEDLDVRSDDEGSDDEDDLVESEDSDDESSSIAATITSTTRDSSTTSLISSISPTVTSTIPVITSTSARPTVTSSIRRTTDVGSISTSSIARSTVTSSPTSSPISSLPSASKNVSNTAGGIDSPPSPTGASIAPATIAGVTILGIFALLVTLFLLWCRRRRRNAWSNSSDEKFTVFPFPFPVEYATQQPRAPEYTRSNHSGMSWVSEGSWTVRASKISNFVRGPRFSRFTRATQPESTNTNSTVSRSLWN